MNEEQTQSELPLYRCHKEVRALKIGEIVRFTCLTPGTGAVGEYYTLHGIDGGKVEVSADYINKHKPKIHGYYVRYADEYESYSPRAAFEEGYTLIDGDAG